MNDDKMHINAKKNSPDILALNYEQDADERNDYKDVSLPFILLCILAEILIAFILEPFLEGFYKDGSILLSCVVVFTWTFLTVCISPFSGKKCWVFIVVGIISLTSMFYLPLSPIKHFIPAQLGIASSENAYAVSLENEMTDEIDKSELEYWYNRASDHGSIIADWNLARLYISDRYEPKNYQGAIEHFESIICKGQESHKAGKEKFIASAMFELASIYEKGLGTERNLQRALDLYTRSSEYGNVDSLRRLGLAYYNEELDVCRDLEQSKRFLRAASDQDDAASKYNLAIILSKDNKSETQEFMNLLEEAANSDYLPAQSILGKWYMGVEDPGIEEDYKKAFHYNELASEKGDIDSQNRLGFMYFKGKGVSENKHKAIELWTDTANKNNAYSQAMLGFCYLKGDGIERDYTSAIPLLKSASEKGNTFAQYWLGYCYKTGCGVEIDKKLALELWKQAANNGSDAARSAIGELKSEGIPNYNIEVVYPVGWSFEP